MNTIGIDDNLNRARIKKLLTIGLVASLITAAGDFLLGFGTETPGKSFVSNLLANALHLSDSQIIWGGLLGMFGIFLEGLSFFAIYRLMADRSPHYAHLYRTGIFGYIWLAPIGTHMNMSVFTFAYKYLLKSNSSLADQVGNQLLYAFGMPVWLLLIIFWMLMIIVQFKAFAKGMTPYPRYAKWFNLIIGMIPALIISVMIGPHTALGAAIGTMGISLGNAFTFGGLLWTLPSEEQFELYKQELNNTKK